MKNLYDVLEVSRKASSEIIEKAYKTLAKKYHPDLQDGSNRVECEEKMKEINEAYEILSHEQKRKQYDEKLAIEDEMEIQKRVQENFKSNNVSDSHNENYYEEENKINEEQIRNYYRNIEEQLKKQDEYRRKEAEAYRRNYIEYLKSLGYKIKYKLTMKELFVILIAIVTLIIIGMILWKVPQIHNWLIELYNNNFGVKIVVDIIMRNM